MLFSIQFTRAMKSWFGAGSGTLLVVNGGPAEPLSEPIPAQCPMPGIRKRRLKLLTWASPPTDDETRLK